MSITTRHSSDPARGLAATGAVAWLIGVALVLVANFAIREPMIGGGQHAESLGRIAERISLFRLSTGFDAIYGVTVLVVGVAWYGLLRPAGSALAVWGLTAKVVYASTALLSSVAWSVVGRAAVHHASRDVEDGAIVMRLASGALSDLYYSGLLLWALSSAAFFVLWRRTGALPRGVAAFGMAGAWWCAGCALAYLISPRFGQLVNPWAFDLPLVGTELFVSLLLLWRAGTGRSIGSDQ